MESDQNDNLQLNDKLKNITLNIIPENITYGYSYYSQFTVRKVYINNVLKGEYHIAVNDITIQNMIFFLNKYLGNECDIGLIDPTMVLNLDYPIFIIIKKEIIKDVIDDIFETIYKELKFHE
jgi:hypothetical protein